ncbi:MAG: hypothetical protein AAF298_23010 [Cyanobacteria bacterium P01_A01_bin.40]
MTTDKGSRQQFKTKQLGSNPLADIAGKFGGELWLETLSEIDNARKKDKEETSKNLDIESNESN